MAQTFQASRMWERISEFWVTEDAAVDLTSFKVDHRNYNLSLWDPTVNGVRYLKAMLYHVAMELTDEDWARVKNIRNREVGGPITVRINGEPVCMDYLQASLELGFIEPHVALDGARVLEIGAGYGRTCHATLSNHDLSGYCIIDLKNTLGLSRRYLREVLDDEQFAKITFVEVDEIGSALPAEDFDLCVNIHSLTEMPPRTVRAYLDLIAARCGAFFVKNPVGKFLDKSLDGHSKGEEAVRNALEAGPLREVVDIYDNEAVEARVPDFVEAYRPAEDWRCVADGRAIPWSYFWQAIFKKP
ncbi:putative sugar O-methyltransferase [Nonomuraea sp. NPDC048826]|uniref:putative sugar O-methyltransferase n=1 Tax=Nonomuraea sp. NPDC048826 TaxID=3364347 RepID=UPI0037232420